MRTLWDFTRCVRPNGTAYGTSGQCRKGVEQEKKFRPEGEKEKQDRERELFEYLLKKRYEDQPERKEKALRRYEQNEKLADKLRKSDDGETEVLAAYAGVTMTRRLSNFDEVSLDFDGRTVSFKANGEFDYGTIEDERDRVKAVLQVRRMFQSLVRNLKPGTILDATAYDEDGREEQRRKAYERIGFVSTDDGTLMARVSTSGGLEPSPSFSEGVGSLRDWYVILFGASAGEDFSEDFLNFTRCVRPNGTAYGTPGQCRKGVEQKEEGADVRRRKRREDILKQAQHHKDSNPGTLKDNLETLNNLIQNEPGFRSPLTESTLKALRFLRLKSYLESAEAKRKEEASLEVETKELLDNSPKYSQTPGSRGPLPRLTQEEEVKRLEREMEVVKSRIRALGEPVDNRERAELALLQKEGMSLGRNLSNAKKGDPIVPELSSIYSRQGYNARPQVVAKASDLETMPGLMNGPDGKRIVAYRGVTSAEYSLQFKGGGPGGDVHFPGRGVFGNGSYAASAPVNEPPSKGDTPQKIASNYTDLWEGGNTDLRRQVTAFAFREDARVKTFKTEKEYDSWRVKTYAEAAEKTGYPFSDIGAAAAALGYHAYSVPVLQSADYWVVLNRGAIVVAADSELKADDYR